MAKKDPRRKTRKIASAATSRSSRASRDTSPIRVAIVGTKFMGRAHSTGWNGANRFFDLPRGLELAAAAGRDSRETAAFAKRWGWSRATTDWMSLLEGDEVDLVDVATPNNLHAEMSIAALEAGKHVACEKPLAATLDQARTMRDAAKKAAKRGLRTYVWFNYRRCPAIAFARQLVMEGRLGPLFHVRASYLQDWGRAGTPLLWRFDSKVAGSGAHGDLNAHIIDMARFVTGEEFSEVSGAIEKTFVVDREIPGGGGGAISGKGGRASAKRGRSTVDDCVLFLARFTGGAVGTFEATRLATGNQNRNQIEVNGEKGSIRFDFERMNELLWWDDTASCAPTATTIPTRGRTGRRPT
ncbi:MAG: Gfo/Idh/MocA family protein [Planctomycetota bacterium]|jgi:predicted dehydrogenase